MPVLSLCMIARDEEAMLPACLASVVGLVDEIVLVDTGSRDRTAQIAAEAGARVVRHAWADDFAEARTAAVAHASGRFVLVLDADERLAAAGVPALRAAVLADDLDAGFLPLHDADRLDAPEAAVLCGAARRGDPLLVPRLLRRTPELRWEGIVHEHVDTWLGAPGRRLRAVPAPIVHLGYVDAIRAARGKGTRNRRLLERARDAEPARLRPRVALVRELLLAGEHDAARAEAEAAWALVGAAGGPGGQDGIVPLATLRAWIALRDGRVNEALVAVDAAALHGVLHPNLDLLRGHALELLALGLRDDARVVHLVRARACFERCLAQSGALSTETMSPGATSWSAATRLGTVLLLLEQPSLARDAFAMALAARPDHLEARLGHVEALLDCGEPAAALDAVLPLLGVARLDGWLLAVCATHALGRAGDTWALLAEARRHAGTGLLAPHRRERLEAVAQLLAA